MDPELITNKSIWGETKNLINFFILKVLLISRAHQICATIICGYEVINTKNMILYTLKNTQGMTLHAVINIKIIFFVKHIILFLKF